MIFFIISLLCLNPSNILLICNRFIDVRWRLHFWRRWGFWYGACIMITITSIIWAARSWIASWTWPETISSTGPIIPTVAIIVPSTITKIAILEASIEAIACWKQENTLITFNNAKNRLVMLTIVEETRPIIVGIISG